VRPLSLAILFGALCCAGTEPAPETTEHRVAGLNRSAEILVDGWGVPHIYAQNLDDLFFAQGFNAARDRLWQLDLWKRRGEGRLAEVFGQEFVERDRAARLLLYRGEMYSEWLAYASDAKRIVGAFVAGINAYILQTRADPRLLPPEFEVFNYEPALWKPETIVRIRSHGLLRNAQSEVERAVFLRTYGASVLSLRETLEPPHRVEVPDGLDLGAIQSQIMADYELGTAAVTFSGAAGASAEPLERSRAARGSNNWAVAGSRTATGRALLANDPHRRQSVPSLRYIAHLSAPGLDVIGGGEPALPGVSIGHNGTIAFGLTIFSIDQEDLYVYETNPDDPASYRYQGRWEPMRVVRERIEVRGRHPVEAELYFTRHGPVLYRDPGQRRAFALRAAWLEPGMAPYLGSIEYMRARSWEEFLAAMNRWGAPSENQVFADTAGHIGWKPGGRAPIRRGWDGLLPVPGDGRYEWDGFYDMDQLPVELDPARGWVATANEMNLPDGYPHPHGYEWRPPFRMQRIREVLEADTDLTIAEALRLQNDYVSLPARRVLRAIEGVRSDDPKTRQARELLRGWDARLGVDSPAAALFEVWFRRHLGPALLAGIRLDPAAIQALEGGDVSARLALLETPGARFGDDPVSARDQAVAESLASALAATEELLGEAPGNWRWGALHTIELHHAMDARFAPELRQLSRVGPAERGGSGETVGNTFYRPDDFQQIVGASFRIVVDVGDWDRSVAMNSPGQSGDPRNPHYRDLFDLWAYDGAFPLLYSRQRVLEAAEQRIRLLPAKAR